MIFSPVQNILSHNDIVTHSHCTLTAYPQLYWWCDLPTQYMFTPTAYRLCRVGADSPWWVQLTWEIHPHKTEKKILFHFCRHDIWFGLFLLADKLLKLFVDFFMPQQNFWKCFHDPTLCPSKFSCSIRFLSPQSQYHHQGLGNGSTQVQSRRQMPWADTNKNI